MVYFILPFAGLAVGGSGAWVVAQVYDGCATATAKQWHGLAADCTPYPSQWTEPAPPTASTALGTAAAVVTAIASMRLGHQLVWRRVSYELQAELGVAGPGKIESVSDFSKSFGAPLLAWYGNALCAAVPAGVVKPLVDGPGPHDAASR